MLEILLVDDNPGDQLLFKDTIEELGLECRLHYSLSAAESVKIINDLRPDIVFMDFIMPGVSGGDFVRMLGQDFTTQSIPIVFLTGVIEAEKSPTTFTINGRTYLALAKPVEPEALREAIMKVRIRENVGRR